MAKSKPKPPGNAFEAHGNRKLHFDVLGRKVAGATRNVALARADALARRSGALLEELRGAGRRNVLTERQVKKRRRLMRHTKRR